MTDAGQPAPETTAAAADEEPEQDSVTEEDIAALEDNPAEESAEPAVISGGGETVAPDTPLYRLLLPYLRTAFLGAYAGPPLAPGGMVVVPTPFGADLARVTAPFTRRSGDPLPEVTRIYRPADRHDLDRAAENERMEPRAFDICRERIAAHSLGMKLVSVHFPLDEPRILFFFTADGRVDFRELVKDLNRAFKCRVELRQIASRDETRLMGGLGLCGRDFCCRRALSKPKTVSIKMAREQSVSLTSIRVSGTCGRLLCCLAHEHLFYHEQRPTAPCEGCKIPCGSGMWRVKEVNLLTRQIRLDDEDGREMTLPASAFEKVDNRWLLRSESGAPEESGAE
jgi:cell fate regulator YaaT (PSP1 superfamily)